MTVVVIAILGALIPTAGYVLLSWWIDRYEKEPVGLLAAAFLWGAGPAAILSIVLEIAFAVPVSVLGSESLLGRLLSASVGAPLIEESAKGIALIFLFLVVPKAFDGMLDGIIFGAMIGFGFAMTEDVVAYFIPIMSQHGLSAGLINIFLRTGVFGFNHAFWTGLFGASVGYARLVRSQKRRLPALMIGGALAVLMHSLHNLGATLVERTVFLSLGFSALLDWSGVLALAIVIVLELRTERRWIERGLSEEVQQGALSPQEFDLLHSARRRWQANRQARRQGGRTGARVVERYFQTATRLAFNKQHLRVLGDEGRSLAEIERLQLELAQRRAEAWPWLWPAES
ncbi:MAG: PrsW family intramembrane metalloprotease [Anaerolineae bacterium]|nr:PrsW family intramembrane metalloprotease [Anaerolineae bacterium]